MTRRYSIFIITALVALLSLNLCFMALAWGWFGKYTGAGSGFCETMRPGWIKQPANSWSNLGFVLAGLLMAWSLAMGRFQHNRNALTQSSLVATCFSCLVVLLGPGSMAMHASGTRLGGFLDVLSMYLVASFLLAYSAQRVWQIRPIFFVIVFAILLAGCIVADRYGTFRLFKLGSGNLAFATCLTLTAVLEAQMIFARKHFEGAAWAYASLASILLAYFIWNMSRTDCPWCVPDSLLQGHAAWHLLDALSVYCLFRYYVSEDEKVPATGFEPVTNGL